MWLERYTNMAREVIAFIDRFPHITLIVRTSVPGHTNCSQYSAPLLEDDPESHNSYNWQGFTLFNNIWRDLLVEHPKHILLDVGATTLRGDGHRNPDVDCLHYCLPGGLCLLFLISPPPSPSPSTLTDGVLLGARADPFAPQVLSIPGTFFSATSFWAYSV